MRDRSIGWVIFGFLLACYLLTYTGILQSSDGLAMFSTAESIARHGDGDMNQLLWMGAQQGNIGADGNLYGRKGLGMTLLALPLVWGGMLWSRLGLVHSALLLNPILTALTGALIYRAGIRLGWRRATATAAALGFGLATMAWPYTQTFFSDPVSAFGLFGAFYGLLAFSQTGRKYYLVGGASAWGIAYLSRTINLATLPIFLVGLWVVLQMRVDVEQSGPRGAERESQTGWRAVFAYQWRPMVSFLTPVVLAGLISLWWNAYRFGSIWDSGYVSTETFSGPWLAGIYGLTIGPARRTHLVQPDSAAGNPRHGVVLASRTPLAAADWRTCGGLHPALRQMVHVAWRLQLGPSISRAAAAIPDSTRRTNVGAPRLSPSLGMGGGHCCLAARHRFNWRPVVWHGHSLWPCAGLPGRHRAAALCTGDLYATALFAADLAGALH